MTERETKEIKERERRRKMLKKKRNQQVRMMRSTLIIGMLVLCAAIGVMVSGLGKSSRKRNNVQAAVNTEAGLVATVETMSDSIRETVALKANRTDLPEVGAIYGIYVYGKDWSRFLADNSYCMAPAGAYVTAFRATLHNQPEDMSGTIEYRVNLSGAGWQDWVENANTAGQEDTEAPLEAISIRLTGELSEYYDVLYSVLQGQVWTEWVQNGAEAGISGAGKRVDGIRISVVKRTEGQPSYAGNIDPNKPMVALTYDDGPKAQVTSRLLELLKQNDAKATFFMVGNMAAKNQGLVKQMQEEGHEVANHTYDHKLMNKIAPAELTYQLERANQVISDSCGLSPVLMRPCGGAKTAAGMEAVGSISMPAIMWSIDTLDWKTRDAQSTIQAVRDNVKDGDIILMHDLYDTTADASEVIIPELIAQGYQLVTVSELASYRGGMLPGMSYSKFPPK